MKTQQFRFKKYIIQMIYRTMVVLFVIGFFGMTAYSQIATTTPASRCGEGTLVLHATATSGTIKWYTSPFYGAAIVTGVSGDGTTFTTPSQIVTTAYYVDAVDGSNCSLNSGKVRVPVLATVSANSIQAAIFYSSNTFCKSISGAQTVTRTGTAGGVYSATAGGLTINSASGDLTPSSSTVGTYTVTYTVTASEGCIENPASTSVTIANAPLTSSISYNSSPYCTSLTSATVTLTNPNGGTFSASPSGLSIDPASGTINPSLSEPGTYTVTYVVSGAGGCAPQEPTASVTITGLPTATITYTDAPFCKSLATAQTPILTGTGAYTGGSYSYTGGTLTSFNTSTGSFVPSTSTAGTYTVTYTAPASANCAAVPENTSVTVNPLPTATIGGTTSVCQNAAEPNVTFTGITGTAPFTFTYTVGSGANQTVTTTSGSSVTVAQPTTSAGSYIYTLVSVADAHECSQAASGTATITVTGTPVATFSYIGTPFCKIGTVSPTLAPGGSAGTFSGTSVVFVSTSTGEINLASTPAGTYTITNTINSCGTPVVATSDVTINALPTASIGGTTACGSSVLTATTNATSPSYVWYLGGTVIAGEIASTLTASVNGSYTVKVKDGTNGCEITSAAHSVTLLALPTASITGTLSTCATPTTITAVTDATSPSYVWYKNDAVISGQTASTLSATGSGDYKVKVTNGSTTCENTSAAVFVSIALVDDPGTVGGGQTVCTDASNSTALTLSGTKSTVLNWQYSINSGSTWTDIANTTTAYTATGLTQTTEFRAAVQNGICPVAYSVPATVTVVPDPTISVQPAATTSECIGGTAQLSVTAANGTGGYTYQWYTNAANNNTTGTSIPGATTSTYTPPTASAGTVYYYVIVGAAGSGCGTATSNVAAVTTVATSPSWISYSNPTPTTLCAGGTVAFSVSISGGSGGTVSWIRSNNATPGAGTEVTVTTGEIPVSGTWYYRPHYTATSSGCTLTDGTQTTVTVVADPTISTQPTATTTICEGGSASLSVIAANGTGTFSYQWQYNNEGWGNVSNGTPTGATYTGATTANLTVSGITGIWANNEYRCVVTSSGSGCDPVTSAIANVPVVAVPTPSFTAQPGATANTSTDVTYTTQSGKSNYVWTFPGTVTTDYTITSGGTSTDYTVTLKYVTTGSKTVTINYTANGCTAASATSSTPTTVTSFSGDAIYNALSTSQASYTAASANSLVKISSTEYAAVKLALSATAIGYTGAFSDWATTSAADNTTFSYNGNANDQTTSTFSALNYPVALSFHPASNPAASYDCQLKYNNGGTVVNITSLYSGATVATIDRQYFVIKTPAQLPNASPYISLYCSKGIATVSGTGSHYWDWVSGNVTGSQIFTSETGNINQLPSIQVLQTGTKQWP